MATRSSTCGADRPAATVGEAGAPRAADEIVEPGLGRLAFRPGPRGLPSWWEGRYRWKPDDADVTLRIEAGGGRERPSAAQRAFIDDLEQRYPYYSASALVLLKPAFAKYVGRQLRLQSMLEEFELVRVTLWSMMSSPLVHEFVYRCTTDRTKAFFVTFEDRWARRIRVDEA